MIHTYTERQEIGLFFVLPVIRRCYHFARCGCCGQRLVLRVPPDALAASAAHERERLVCVEGVTVGTVLAVLALLFSCMPMLGAGLGIAAVITTRRRPRWERIVSWLALVLSVISVPIALALLRLGGR